MYRFARTYGFVHFSYSDHNTNDERTRCERPRKSNLPILQTGATSSKDSLRLKLPPPSPPLTIPVRLADVATAPQAVAGGVAGVEVAKGGSTRAASAPAGTKAAAEATACEERLRRYPTSAEEDLRLLRLLNSKESENQRRRMANLTTTSGEVTTEWVQMCVALRAAEKIALQRELRGRKPALH